MQGIIMLKCCDMTAGMLRHPIIIQRQTKVPNDSGGQEIVWSTHKLMKAQVKPKSGR